LDDNLLSGFPQGFFEPTPVLSNLYAIFVLQLREGLSSFALGLPRTPSPHRIAHIIACTPFSFSRIFIILQRPLAESVPVP
jgi:hypothetical protein